jgi:hypothetical protein
MSDHARVAFCYEALDPDTRLFVLQKTDELHGLMKRTKCPFSLPLCSTN